MRSLVFVDTFNEFDIIIQMCRSSFDIHVQEILGTLVTGALLVMLHPLGTLDLKYLIAVLQTKTITYMHSVPTLLENLFDYAQEHQCQQAMKSLRSVCSSGKR